MATSASSPRPESWKYAPELGPQSRDAAQQAAQMIRGVMMPAAEALSMGGFVVPSPEALEHAAGVFKGVQAMAGGDNLRHPVLPAERVAVICALASAVQGFEQEMDLDAFGAWWNWRETNEVVRDAAAVLALVNAARGEDVLRWLIEDLQRYDREQGEAR